MQFWQLLSVLTAKRWVWKAAIAGLCGNVTHTLLMLGKAKLGILESFQPYQSLQIALSYSTGENIHPLMPWLLSYINGSTVAGFTFANFYHHLPGNGGPIKGFVAGIFGWLAMDLIFFPLLGLGPFAMHLGLGIWPALFSLGMMLAYSIVMGLVYGMIDPESDLAAVRNAIVAEPHIFKVFAASWVSRQGQVASERGHQMACDPGRHPARTAPASAACHQTMRPPPQTRTWPLM